MEEMEISEIIAAIVGVGGVIFAFIRGNRYGIRKKLLIPSSYGVFFVAIYSIIFTICIFALRALGVYP
jgi:hypothetical protein